MAWSKMASEAGSLSTRPARRDRIKTNSDSMPCSRNKATSNKDLSLQSPNPRNNTWLAG